MSLELCDSLFDKKEIKTWIEWIGTDGVIECTVSVTFKAAAVLNSWWSCYKLNLHHLAPILKTVRLEELIAKTWSCLHICISQWWFQPIEWVSITIPASYSCWMVYAQTSLAFHDDCCCQMDQAHAFDVDLDKAILSSQQLQSDSVTSVS